MSQLIMEILIEIESRTISIIIRWDVFYFRYLCDFIKNETFHMIYVIYMSNVMILYCILVKISVSVVTGVEPRFSHVLGKHSAPELH